MEAPASPSSPGGIEEEEEPSGSPPGSARPMGTSRSSSRPDLLQGCRGRRSGHPQENQTIWTGGQAGGHPWLHGQAVSAPFPPAKTDRQASCYYLVAIVCM